MKKINFLVVLTCLLFSTNLKAIDGYYMLGYGTLSKGMGGVGAAYYKASIISNNPAGRVFLGNKYSVAANFMLPNVSYNVSGSITGEPAFSLQLGKVESDINLLFIPNIGANWQLNDKSAVGFSISGSGIASKYPTQTFYDPSVETTGINYMQLCFDPSYSYKIGEKHSFGISALVTYQRFKADGLLAFSGFSTNANKLSGNDFDSGFGVGFKIGYMGEVLEGLHIGATYQTKTSMSEFSEYEGLFAKKGGFDAPSQWSAGINYEISDKLRILCDVQQIMFSDNKAIGNPVQSLLVTAGSLDGATFTNTDGLLGNDKGAGFGWEDMTIVKFGAEYAANEKTILRAGYAFGDEPIPSSEVLFNILAPAINNQHITFGATRKVNNKDVNFALVYAPKNNVKGINPLDPAQNIELEMSVLELEFSLTF